MYVWSVIAEAPDNPQKILVDFLYFLIFTLKLSFCIFQRLLLIKHSSLRTVENLLCNISEQAQCLMKPRAIKSHFICLLFILYLIIPVNIRQ